MALNIFIYLFLPLLIIINAFIAAFGSALHRISPLHIEELSTSTDPIKVRLASLLSKPEQVIASISFTHHLLSFTIALLIIALPWSSTIFVRSSIEALIFRSIIAFAVILLFNQIIPNRAVVGHPLRFLERHSRSIGWINKMMTPLSGLLGTTGLFLNPFLPPDNHDLSVDQLSKALGITSDENRGEQEKELLEGIIRFRDKMVGDIFVSRTNMVALELSTTFPDVIQFIVNAGFSRIPVYEVNPDTIKGILYVKDLLPHLGKRANFRWQSLIRPAFFVPATKRIDDLLEEFRAHKIHMAIVVDEYGGTAGLVTMEDILEEIVGDISDEYDEEQPFYTMAPDGSYLFEGTTPLEEFIRITSLPDKDFKVMQEEVDTLAGLLLELKGDFPKRKESFTYHQHIFVAEEMSKKRITKVRYIPPVEEEDKA